MKKLSLLLLTLCVSLAGWATDNDDTPGLEYTLNPYAYDLKIKSWDESSQTLTVQFKLNAPPNLNGDEYNKVTDIEPNGIQIFAVDPQGNRYRIAGPGRDVIKAAHVNNNGQYELRIDLSTAKSVGGNNPGVDIPKNVPLTWEVQVKGRNNTATKGRKSPTLVFTDITTKNSLFYPRAAHGIAIEKKPLNPHFGKIFVADACIDHLKAAGYKYNGSALLIYDPHLKYTDYELKVKYEEGKMNGFSTTVNYEPHRVCVSEDGRVFVTCYNPDADAIVMELVGNDNFRTIIKADKAQNKDETVIRSADGNNTLLYPADTKYNDRPIAMDVKKTDEGLKILVAMLTPKGKIATKGTNRRVFSKITCYEYTLDDDDVNVEQYNLSNGKCKVVAEFYDVATDGTNDGSSQGEGMLFQCVFNDYNSIKQGLINVKYGEEENNPIWMKVDFGFSKNEGRNGRILYFDNTGSNPTVPKYTYLIPVSYCNANAMYGGGGMYIKGNQLLTGSGNNSVLFFNINNSNSVPNLTYNTSLASGSRGTGAWIDAFAEDFAANIYALSEAADNIIVIAMPYDGVRRTPSPAGQTFTLSDPVPNILATDLRYEVNNANEYIFSFNTNTQPEYAELRFYKSYESMKQSLAVVNADDFDGDMNVGHNDENLVCYYPITKGLKQGKISVTLGGVGGTIENKVITNDRLPAGELYWSVYVQTRKNSVFAPIYKQGTTGEDAHYRLHATANNYPETDQFGQLYAVNYYAGGDARNGLMVYGFNPNGDSDDEQSTILNSNRYKLVENYLNPSGNKPKFTNQRRLDVAPDGKVYIADCGSSLTFKSDAERPWMFQGGGVFVWNPNTQTGNEIQISQFTLDKTETSTAVTIYNHNGQMKLYATNTYGEFDNHANNKNYWKGYEYTEANQANVNIYGWNGFKEFNLGTPENILLQETTGTTPYSLGMGDGNGNISIVATEKGIWMAQHREGDVQYSLDNDQALPDVPANYILSFIPYGNTTSSNPWGGRTWRSCTTIGTGSYANQKSANSQTVDAPLQSCPGAGLAYRKVNNKEYLYIVQHSGDIAQFEIRSWNGTTPSVYHIRTYPSVGTKTVIGYGTSAQTTRPTGTITSMCFDYAGNLITTAGQTYFKEGMGSQDIVVYTMPYDRVNAREIQAPNSCRMIPERLAYLDMSAQELELVINNHTDHDGCAIELFRPLQAGMFNTICLPFELDFANLPDEHPFKDAEVKAFTGVVLEDVGGEKVLSLVFSDITQGSQKIMSANVPYLLEPMEDIVGSVRFDNPVRLTSIEGNVVGFDFDGNHIDFKGVVPITPLEATYADGIPLKLLLVADNRLAALTSNANILGFRAYFQLAKPLPAGTSAKIVGKKPVTTNTTIVVDGKKVNVDKFLREGRVYIRVGETLYTITGEVVGR